MVVGGPVVVYGRALHTPEVGSEVFRPMRALLTTMLFAICSPAWAADVTVAVVGVHDASLDLATQAELAAALGAAVEVNGRFDALSPDAFALELAGRETQVLEAAFLVDGRRLLERGRGLFMQAQLEAALPVLQQASTELSAAVPLTNSVRDLWDSWMLLATVHHNLGDEVNARDALTSAIALDAVRRPDSAVFPPRVLELFDEEHSNAMAELTALEVSVQAEAATVFVDGSSRGPSPAWIEDLAPGTHHVLARSAGGEVGYRRVEVLAGEEDAITLEVSAPRLESVRPVPPARQTGALYRALGRFGSPDLLLLTGRTPDGWAVQLHAPAQDAFSTPVVLGAAPSRTELITAVDRILQQVGRTAELPVVMPPPTAIALKSADNAILASMLLVPAPALVVPVPEPVVVHSRPPRPPKRPEADGKKTPWWVYAAIGGGTAALAATAVGLGVGLGGDGSPVVAGHDGSITIGPPVSR